MWSVPQVVVTLIYLQVKNLLLECYRITGQHTFLTSIKRKANLEKLRREKSFSSNQWEKNEEINVFLRKSSSFLNFVNLV